jgi:hypothetical protein
MRIISSDLKKLTEIKFKALTEVHTNMNVTTRNP